MDQNFRICNLEDLQKAWYLIKHHWKVISFKFLQAGYWDTDEEIKSIDLTGLKLADEESEKEEGFIYLLKKDNRLIIETFNKQNFYLIDHLDQSHLTLSVFIENHWAEALKVFTIELEK